MKKPTQLLCAIPLLVSLLAPCASALDQATALPVATASGSHEQLAGNIHSQVNAYRQSLGKPGLKRNAGLDRLARQHSEFMRRNRGKFGKGSKGNITHFGFEERSMMAQRGMGMSDVGENVATCSRTARPANVLVEAWKKSKGHQMNLKGSWTQTGIGVVVDADGTVFATQLFGNIDHSHMTLTNRMRSF